MTIKYVFDIAYENSKYKILAYKVFVNEYGQFSSILKTKEHDGLSKKSFHRNVGAKNIKAVKYWMGVGLKQIELKKKLFLKTLQTR